MKVSGAQLFGVSRNRYEARLFLVRRGVQYKLSAKVDRAGIYWLICEMYKKKLSDHIILNI